ncbi:MMPL family transporter [Pseudomonas sp. App30]|uniref:MMPL family transporter n=1 Tax=Pseudomonas sp. App30 TaxID=3068990 RepID=UPI003A7FEC7A
MHQLIATLVHHCARRPWTVLVVAALLALLSLQAASHRLSMDTDADHLFADDLPWRQQSQAFARQFPQFSDTLVVVIRAPSDEEAHDAAVTLAGQLAADNAHFREVSTPGISTFFDREGLMLLPPDELYSVIDSMTQGGQLLDPLAADPSARGLLKALDRLVEGVSMGMDLVPYNVALGRVADTFEQAQAGRPVPLSWQALLTPQLAGRSGGLQLILLQPVLDHEALEPGQAATAALLQLAAALPEVKAGRVQVNYTGSVPLADEEFESLSDRAVPIALGGGLLVIVLLVLALRTWQTVLAVLLTLVLGLVYTLGYAALAVGRLNLVSVAFAVLFIGLAVDFGIQFGVRLRALEQPGQSLAASLRLTGLEVGGQIGLAALATACGFLAFAPTSFSGMAELGSIAGVGMLLALACTLTVLPALLGLLPRSRRASAGETGLPGGHRGDAWLARRRWPVLRVFGLLAVAGLYSALSLPFDANPLHTKRADTEAMLTLTGLMDDPNTNPFTLNVLAPDLDSARILSARLSALPDVAQVVSGADFVPLNQTQQLDQIRQALDLMYGVLEPRQALPAPTAAQLREAAAHTHAAITGLGAQVPPGTPLARISAALDGLARGPDSALLLANQALAQFLPVTFKRLADSLAAQPISAEGLPEGLRRDWFTADGQVRVQVTPGAQAQSTEGLRRFVASVQKVAPQAVGAALDTVQAADTILQAFEQAALYATLAIAVVLVLVLRRLRDMVLVLATLLMSALLTALFARLLGMSLNFANIIALPLLLGVGVSFNIYFVMNARAGQRQCLGSPTARAVLFSALTTGTAFGSLAIARHPGTASMGLLLLLSLAAVLVSTFAFLPALLYSPVATRTVAAAEGCAGPEPR